MNRFRKAWLVLIGKDVSPADDGPVALLGFPAAFPVPEHDLIYPGCTQLTGYRYRPVWGIENHPDVRRERAKNNNKSAAASG